MPPTLTATTVDAATLAEELARYRVVEADRLTAALAGFAGGGPVALAETLVARGVLTPFQAGRALAGEARGLALGPYRLTGVHGLGTLGPVFRARRTGRGGGEFVVRAMPLRSLWQAKEAKKLARALAALPPHPGVVPLVDADSANGFHYLVWPVTPGGTLFDRVRATGPLAPGEAATLLAHLLAALAACHAGQAVHGLLSPHAVAPAADPGGVPRVLELGAGALLAANLAAAESLFDTMTAAVAVAGALDYAAPEWRADPTAPTAAGDHYAAGAVGYFALTGRPPGGPDSAALADLNPAIPADLAALVERLLCPDPADRFTSADEARDAFAAATGHQDLMNLICPPSEPLAAAASRRAGERTDGSRHGALSWGGGTAGALPPARDDSDASIQFDLDIPPEPTVGPGGPSFAEATDDDSGVFAREPGAPPYPADRGRAAFPPGPPAAVVPQRSLLLGAPTDEKGRRGFVPPPLLPAAPLAPGGGTRAKPAPPDSARTPLPPPPAPLPPPASKSESLAWKSLKRKVLFWQEPADAIRVSVFGPATVARSESPRVTVYLYPPAAADSVATLARAFQQGAVLLGTTAISHPVVRGSRVAVHLAVAHAAVTSPLGKFKWQGQPQRVTFDLVVPWEAPGGPAAGVVSVGQDDVRIGKAEFSLLVREE